MLGACPWALCDAFALTFAASLPILPATVAVFSRLPLLSPLANLIAAPVFTVFLYRRASCSRVACGCARCGVGGACHSRARSRCFFRRRGRSGRAAFLVLHSRCRGYACSRFHRRVRCGAFVGAVARYLSQKALRLGLCFVLAGGVAYLVVVPYAAKDEVVMLDVGQGDAFLIRSEGASLLVDTGNQEQKLLSALARHGVSSLDGVAISHHDDDHCGCLGVFVREYRRRRAAFLRNLRLRLRRLRAAVVGCSRCRWGRTRAGRERGRYGARGRNSRARSSGRIRSRRKEAMRTASAFWCRLTPRRTAAPSRASF